jgi:hypothetical protein
MQAMISGKCRQTISRVMLNAHMPRAGGTRRCGGGFAFIRRTRPHQSRQ